jgi:serine O-acetyltransferase
MTLKELIMYWKSVYQGHRNIGAKPLNIILFTPGFIYTFYMYLCRYLKFSRFHKIYFPFYIFFRMILRHYEFKFGIQIPYNTKIGFGFYIGHYGGIIVNSQAEIGNYVAISPGVTIGYARTGVPKIGSNVYIGSGAKIIGGITVGNNVSIGANCVVTKDVPDNGVIVGVPGKVISYNKV